MPDDAWTFHLFAATFSSDQAARDYALEQWAPEPAASASEAEFSAWEASNPTWRLKQELGFYMDADFVELVDDVEYVLAQIRNPAQQQAFRAKAATYSHFILVGLDAIWGDPRSDNAGDPLREPQGTATIDYLGRYN